MKYIFSLVLSHWLPTTDLGTVNAPQASFKCSAKKIKIELSLCCRINATAEQVRVFICSSSTITVHQGILIQLFYSADIPWDRN